MKITKNLILSLLVGATVYLLLKYEKQLQKNSELTDEALELLNKWAEQQVISKELQIALNELKEPSPIKEASK